MKTTYVQGMLLLSIYCVCTLSEERYSKLTPLAKLMQNLSFPIALFISILSWCLNIPVDYGGLWTFKNHFFHTFNSISCLLSMAFYRQVWKPKQFYIPLLYGLGYAAFACISQARGNYPLPYLLYLCNPNIKGVVNLVCASPCLC